MLVAGAGVIAVSLAGCATQRSSEAVDRATLAKSAFGADRAGPTVNSEVLGETAAIYGDNQTAVKLFERSVAERPTVLNEFNLASEYERTGRPLEAIDFYSRVAHSGSLEEATTESPKRQNGKERTFVLADEAWRRLIFLQLVSNTARRDAASLSANQAARWDAGAQPK